MSRAPGTRLIAIASEDRRVTQPLAEALRASGISVWFDEYELVIGDSLRRRIEEGLRISRYGLVILSHAFFAKNWPQQELAALTALQKKILPIWHELTVEQVKAYSPLLADVRAANTSWGLERLVAEIRRAVQEDPGRQSGGDRQTVRPSGMKHPTIAGDRLYEDRATWISGTGRGEPAIRGVARFPGDAVRLVPNEVSTIINQAGQQYLNVYNVGLPLASRSSQHIDFETPRTSDGRHIMLQVLQEGVFDIGIYHAWTADRGVPWDWMTGELYTLYLFLNDNRVRSIFRGTGDIRVVPKLAALDNHYVSLQGVKTLLRGSYGRKPNVVFVPLTDLEWRLAADHDPWPAVREFLGVALADSGAYGYEGDIEQMEASYFEMLYFEPIAPSVRFWRPGQPSPEAI
jgi:hypothetical protein